MRNNERLAQIAKICNFSQEELEKKAEKLNKIMNMRGLCGLPILIGFDINGPLVPTEDATLTPFLGTKEVLQFLSGISQVKLCLITGWDMATALKFSNEKLNFKNMNIVSEKGMLFLADSHTYHLYPHSEAEIDNFAAAVFQTAYEERLQFAIQPNISSGCQCVYFEAFYRAKLNKHPCTSGTNMNNQALIEMLKKYNIKFSVLDEKIKIYINPNLLYKILKKELPLHPLRIFNQSDLGKNQICVRVDPNDNLLYDWNMLRETAKKISRRANREFDLNNDYSVDFSTMKAIEGGYSKSSAAQKLGQEIFGSNFTVFNVGDKSGDAIIGNNAIFFPQENTEAMSSLSNQGLCVADGREYALILAFYLKKYSKIGD